MKIKHPSITGGLGAFNVLALSAVLTASSASAAVVSMTTTNISRTGNYDLTTGSNVDWKFWDTISGATTTGGNSKDGVTSVISALTYTAGTTPATDFKNQGSVPMQFNWTDGMSGGEWGASTTGQNLDDILLTGTDLIASGGSLSFTIVGKTTEQTVSIYGMNLGVGEHITFSLAGFSDETVTGDEDQLPAGSDAFRTDFSFTAANDGDLLTVTLRGINGTTTDQRVGFQAVTVSGVPEPSSAALLGLGGLALILRRRK